MREACAVEVAVAQVQDLGLALQPTKRRGMNDARVVDVARVTRVFPSCPPGLAPLQPVSAHHKTFQAMFLFKRRACTKKHRLTRSRCKICVTGARLRSALTDLIADHTADGRTADCAEDASAGDGGTCQTTDTSTRDGCLLAAAHAVPAGTARQRERQNGSCSGTTKITRFHSSDSVVLHETPHTLTQYLRSVAF